MPRFTNVIVTCIGRNYRVAIDANNDQMLAIVRLKADGSDSTKLMLNGEVALVCGERARDKLKRKTYRMWRSAGHAGAVVMQNHVVNPLPMRLDLANHSPDGFEWGYAGSGPAQLALAILADCYDDETAIRNHQKFKLAVVSHQPSGQAWTIHEDELLSWK